jgi:uncharacterized protein YjiS (DUF1127 family)
MKIFSLTRFLRERRIYKNVLRELASYSNQELHDIGIYRADIREIARRMSQEPSSAFQAASVRTR